MPSPGRRGRPAWAWILAAWLVPALLAAFNSLVQDRLEGQSNDWRWVTFNCFDWLGYALLTPLVSLASRRYSLERPHAARTVGVHIAGAFVMCAAWASLGTVLLETLLSQRQKKRSLLLARSATFVGLPAMVRSRLTTHQLSNCSLSAPRLPASGPGVR